MTILQHWQDGDSLKEIAIIKNMTIKQVDNIIKAAWYSVWAI
jgi:DNA-binding CsgD family transcriptional regulator